MAGKMHQKVFRNMQGDRMNFVMLSTICLLLMANVILPSSLYGSERSPQAPRTESHNQSDTTLSAASTSGEGSAGSKDVPHSTSSLGAAPVNPKQNGQNDYRIGAGDVLQISVWKEPDISVPSIVVRPDGRITMPLLKDIEVVGLTPGQVEKMITDGLTNYVTSPNVTVVVTGTNSKKVYVIGAVKKEGPIQYTYRMTIMQALSEAGGLTDYAKRKKIYVLRAENGKQSRIPFDYDAVLNGKQLDQVWLLPSDTLVVPH
jgi:polysaccharide biosynthesis/export protein